MRFKIQPIKDPYYKYVVISSDNKGVVNRIKTTTKKIAQGIVSAAKKHLKKHKK